jgi:hypothetical protein
MPFGAKLETMSSRACRKALVLLRWTFRLSASDLSRLATRLNSNPPLTALKEFRDEIRRTNARGGALHGSATALAQEISRRWLDLWLTGQLPETEETYRQSAERFVRLANDFLERQAASSHPALAELPRSVDLETGFTKESRL